MNTSIIEYLYTCNAPRKRDRDRLNENISTEKPSKVFICIIRVVT